MPGSGNIILTGFMGTGKTTVGRLLAERLDMDFVDTDELIEKRHGPISQIFASSGEEAFRALEREVAAQLAECDRTVIATGGRLMLDPGPRDMLGQTGMTFCLVAAPETLLSRLAQDGSRPLLEDGGRDRLEELLAERREGYSSFPQIVTDGRTPEEIADEIARSLP